MEKKTRRFFVAFLCLALLLAAPAQAFAPYARSEAGFFTVRHTYRVVNTGTQAATGITLTLPSVHPGPFSNQDVLASRFDRSVARSSVDQRGNVSVEIAIPRLEAGAATQVTLEFLAKNYAVAFDLSSGGGPFPPPHPSYLLPEDKIESSHQAIRDKAAEITAGLSHPLEVARAVFAFVQQYMTYDTRPQYRNQGALKALQSGRGVCEDYAALFVALCRAAGVPARVVYGYAAAQNGDGFEAHAWPEFFLSTHGWVPAEPTITAREVPWHYFAALPASYRHIPFALRPKSWQWSWSGGGRVSVTFESLVLPGRHMVIFSDVPAAHWARVPIEELALAGIAGGYQGRFEPARAVTRAEFAKLIALANGLAPDYGPSLFTDVKSGDWFHPVVTAAARAGLLAGFPDGTFRPQEPVTREQIAAILARALGFDGQAAGAALPFGDAQAISPWALAPVAFTVGIGLFGGDDQNRFRPRDNASRAEAAALVYRYLNYR